MNKLYDFAMAIIIACYMIFFVVATAMLLHHAYFKLVA